MTNAVSLHRGAVDALNGRRFAEAEKRLDRARSATDDPDLVARIEASRAFLDYETGHVDRAFERCDRALSAEGLSADARGIIECQRATLLLRRGLTAEALAAFDAGIESLGDRRELGRAHLNRGGVRLAQGDPRAASRDFSVAANCFEQVDDHDQLAMAEHNLGYAEYLSGDLIAALHYMDRSRPTLEAMSPVMAATVNQDRAEVLMVSGLADAGRSSLETAARLYGRRRLRQRQAEAEFALARTALPADPAAARRWARLASARFEKVGAPAWRARAETIALVAEVDLGISTPSVIANGIELANELDAQGLPWLAMTARLQVSRARVRRGVADQAMTRLPAHRLGNAPIAVRLLDRDVRAELAAARGRRADALKHVRAGLADLHEWQSSFGSLDLQTGVVGHGRRLAGRGITLAVASRKPEVLFEWSERARMLVSRVQPVRAPEDEQIGADLSELREIVADGGRRDPEREAELRQRVRERAWQHRGSGEVVDPATLAEFAAALDEETALIAYVATAERLVALVVTGESTTWVDLGNRAAITDPLGGLLPDLDVAASEMPDAMGRFVRQELAARLGTIAERLVAPVLDAVGGRRVVLTPSGVLAGVPWTLLPGFVGRPVTVAQSATSWLARRTNPLRARSAGFVAGPRVARAEDEVTAAAKEWSKARVLTGEAADAAAACELAETVDVLHVAAHGRHSAENPLFSGLQLADGPWFGYDIDRLRSAPDVVLLSACEVGRSNVRWGEELLGMTAAWLHAGARCVIASAAAVNDQAAYDVLVAVHQQLANGIDPAAALAAAVPAVSADTAPVPLVCFG